MIYDEDEERPVFDRPHLTFDRLVRFIVIADNVPGSDFCKSGCMGTATRIGLELGLTVEEAHTRIFNRYEDYRTMFDLDRAAFIRGAALLREQYGDDRLRALYALKERGLGA